jgi:hypothetical protein
MQPWHLTPEALAIIATMQRPAIFHGENIYVTSLDRFARYEGEAVDRLEDIFAEHLTTGIRQISPAALLGAMFGDPMGNPGTAGAWRTHWDNSDEWAAIRADVAGALMAECVA